jgi:hypothetical protein
MDWVGRYSVGITESDTPCTGGDTVDAPHQTSNWTIDRDGSGLVVTNAMCTFHLTIESDTRARFANETCRVVLDGVAGTLEVINGTLTRTNSGLLGGTLNARLGLEDGRCAVATSSLILTPL